MDEAFVAHDTGAKKRMSKLMQKDFLGLISLIKQHIQELKSKVMRT